MAKDETPLISVQDISQEFTIGDEVARPLQNVSFDIMPNSFNIIYGASGSGKSTLLNVLIGLQKPTKGRVNVEGRNVYDLKPDELANFRANKLGFVYQTNFWIESLNVLDNVAMSLYFMGNSRLKAAKMAKDALALVHMESYAKKMPNMLSGGEQQRVAMARALASSPAFIIGDEPTGSLDTKSGEMVMELLKHCQKELGRTIILVTHNMEYLPLADKLLHIEDGHVRVMQAESVHETSMQLLHEMEDRIKRMEETHKNGN